MRTGTKSPISAMIVDMVQQSNEVYMKKASNAIEMGRCSCCVISFPQSELTERKYKSPFGVGEMRIGKFCKGCSEDERVKTLFIE